MIFFVSAIDAFFEFVQTWAEPLRDWCRSLAGSPGSGLAKNFWLARQALPASRRAIAILLVSPDHLNDAL